MKTLQSASLRHGEADGIIQSKFECLRTKRDGKSSIQGELTNNVSAQAARLNEVALFKRQKGLLFALNRPVGEGIIAIHFVEGKSSESIDLNSNPIKNQLYGHSQIYF